MFKSHWSNKDVKVPTKRACSDLHKATYNHFFNIFISILVLSSENDTLFKWWSLCEGVVVSFLVLAGSDFIW